MARQRKAQQGEEAAKAAEQAQQGEEAVPEDFDGFTAWAQRAKVNDGVVLVALTHPDVLEPRHMDGTFSGFRLAPGPASATWNDGSTHPPAAPQP